VIETKSPGYISRQEMPHHTAVIYKVHGRKNYTIAHQNYEGKRKVMLTDINLNNVIKGKVSVYRPVPGF
jgi:hypothetical protein